MNSNNVINCMFESWYQRFKNVTYESECIPLPADFIAYLLADGIVLPTRSNESSNNNEDSEDGWDDAEEAEAPSFPELDTQIQEAIHRLGGSVFIKLNWSSPKDAAWIMLNQSLKCTEPNDVYLLLKSSDFVTHDLTEPFKHCTDRDASDTSGVEYKLVLRAWREMNVSMEFRCFVKDNKLIGISQRHHTHYFDFLQHQGEKITRKIANFYEKKIHSKFPDSSYVFDVFIDKNRVYLMDFNPFGMTTDCLMFSWHELEADESPEAEQDWPEFRYNQNSMVQGNVYQQFTVPQDFVDLASGNDPDKFYDLLHMKIQSQNDTGSSDEESTGG